MSLPAAVDYRVPEVLTVALDQPTPNRQSDLTITAAPAAEAASSIAARSDSIFEMGIDPERSIEEITSGFGCARLSAHYSLASSEVDLSGHVRSTADHDSVLALLTQVPGVDKIESSDLRIVGEPYCELLGLLNRPEFKRSPAQRANLLDVGTDQTGAISVEPGTRLEFAFLAPDFPNHMYVDYFLGNGRVYHLLPVESTTGNQFLPGTTFRIGGDGAGRHLRFAPPLGIDVILSIGSSAQLLSEARPRVEAASDYLRALTTAINTLTKRGEPLQLEYFYYIVDTDSGSMRSVR
jgi:hypothetical protein